jgi:antitoxin (DNA-binding transcriptional repressor) of toxin-antitoxin stability system
MKTASVRELRHDCGRVLGWVEGGEEVEITKYRRVVARIVPPPPKKPRKGKMPDFAARLKRIYGNRKINAVEMLIKERDERGF